MPAFVAPRGGGGGGVTVGVGLRARPPPPAGRVRGGLRRPGGWAAMDLAAASGIRSALVQDAGPYVFLDHLMLQIK